MGVPALSGVIGLDYASPVWDILGVAGTRKYTLKFSNVTDFSWYNSSYVPAFGNHELILG
jgi:hypothetical protein